MDTEPSGTESSSLGSGSSKCEALCCAMSDSISQPRGKALLRKTKSIKCGKARCFCHCGMISLNGFISASCDSKCFVFIV